MPRDYPLMGERAHVAELAERSHVRIRLGGLGPQGPARMARAARQLGAAGVAMSGLARQGATAASALADFKRQDEAFMAGGLPAVEALLGARR